MLGPTGGGGWPVGPGAGGPQSRPAGRLDQAGGAGVGAGALAHLDRRRLPQRWRRAAAAEGGADADRADDRDPEDDQRLGPRPGHHGQRTGRLPPGIRQASRRFGAAWLRTTRLTYLPM